jgi:hypothetical protein
MIQNQWAYDNNIQQKNDYVSYPIDYQIKEVMLKARGIWIVNDFVGGIGNTVLPPPSFSDDIEYWCKKGLVKSHI